MTRTLTPSRPARPPSAHVDDQAAATIPPELRDAARWIVWKWWREGDKWKKPPIDPRKPPGKRQEISHLDPKNWMGFEAARDLVHRGGDGIGFSLGHDGFGELVGVDFDHCLDDAGRITKPDVERWVKALDSYTEVTPSGDGLRVWVKGSIPKAGSPKHDAGIEIYARRRYFTVTGRHLDETPAAINRRQQALDALWRELWPDARPKPRAKANGHGSGHAAGSDDELIERARRARNGAKFSALFFDGDTSGYGGDDNRADLALMNFLAYHTGKDPERMERIFGQSALGRREKWTGRPDYRQRTIDLAIKGCRTVYSPRHGRNGSGGHPSDGNGPDGPPTDGVAHDVREHRPRLANAIPDMQDGKVKHIPILMPELIEDLNAVGKGWPKRVDETLFVPSPDYRPIYLESSTQFFAWLDGKATVYWAKGAGMIGQERLYEHVRKFVADRFEAIESYPHQPPMPGNYYLHPRVRPRRRYDLTERFLDFFHPASDVDRELIRAAILTTFWGGTPGARPAFRFDGPQDDPPELGGRGVGKTKSVELIAAPCGGLVDLRNNETISDLITRLLSEEGRSKRIIRIDNVKTLRLSWADLEALITSKELSGKRLYRGEGRRPNVLTTFITVNGGSLAKDMATRQITIHLARPSPNGTWLRDAFGFVEEHRWDLVAEFLGALSDEPGEIQVASRWDEWEKEVLSRVSFFDRCQAAIAERAKELDADDEDARECEEFFAAKLLEQRHNPETQRIIIPIPIAAQWLSEYEGEPIKAGVVTRVLKNKPLKRLKHDKDDARRFWLWIGPKADPTEARVELGQPPNGLAF
jgi:hypothetical protein